MKTFALTVLLLLLVLCVTPLRSQSHRTPPMSDQMMVYGLVMSTAGCFTGRLSMRAVVDRTRTVMVQDHGFCVGYTKTQAGYKRLPEGEKTTMDEILAEQRSTLIEVFIQHGSAKE
jgi:hypothetical protein